MIKVAALLMAAGNSRRMGGPNKLLVPFNTVPMLTLAIAAVKNANFSDRILITGRDHKLVEQLAENTNLDIVFNAAFLEGFGTSLAAGFSTLLDRPDVSGALVMLGDMPMISATHLNKLIQAFEASGGHAIVRAANDGHPGNPVLIPRPLFWHMSKLEGEQSGKHLLPTSGFPLVLVEIGIAAIADIDTPSELNRLQEALL